MSYFFKRIPVSKGGTGSGNFGHAGVQGQQGGSAPSGIKSTSGDKISVGDKVLVVNTNNSFNGDTVTVTGVDVSNQILFIKVPGKDKEQSVRANQVTHMFN